MKFDTYKPNNLAFDYFNNHDKYKYYKNRTPVINKVSLHVKEILTSVPGALIDTKVSTVLVLQVKGS